MAGNRDFGVGYPPKAIPDSTNRNNNNLAYKCENGRKRFMTYNDVEYVTPRTRILCDILAETPCSEVENALNSSGITPSHELVEAVLKLSYGSSAAAVSFFRWAGFVQKPSEYAWNLMVDLLGKNEMFDQMWDAIRSMKTEGLLSLATFVSVFGSYCEAGRFQDAIMTFEVLEKYGIEPDVVAVNSLLSAICQQKDQTQRAYNFFDQIKSKISPDKDSYAILLEGWERERNVAKAKTTFGELVLRLGWDKENMAAYNAFLNNLVCGSQVEEALKFLHVMKGHGCLPGLKFYSNALDILVKQNDSTHAVPLWHAMVESGIMPNLITFNTMIGLLCNNKDIDNAFRFLDDMPMYGVFPDSFTYNLIFECLINNKRVRQVASFFKEMIKNEFPPRQAICAAAIEMLFDQDDPETALEIWDYVLENIIPVDESANAVLIGLGIVGRLSESKRLAYDMMDRRIIINKTTIDKLRRHFQKEGQGARNSFDILERKWRASLLC